MNRTQKVVAIGLGVAVVTSVFWYLSLNRVPSSATESTLQEKNDETPIPKKAVMVAAQATPFVTDEEVRTSAPFTWSETEISKELWVRNSKNLYTAEEGGNCFFISEVAGVCSRRVFEGTLYAFTQLWSADEQDPRHNLEEIIIPFLEEKGFVGIASVEKGWTTDKTYQLIDGTEAQLVWIKSHPVNLTFTNDGEYPTSDGSIHEMFVSDVFEIGN